MPHLSLIGSLTSPYVRKIRVLLLEKQLPYEWILDDVWGKDPKVTTYNPLGQVPCLLVDRKEAIIDSRVIAEYLEQLVPMHFPTDPQQRFEVLRWMALPDGVMDTVVRYRLEQIRPETLQWTDWFERQKSKLARAFSVLDQHLSTHEYLANNAYSMADISLMCTLGFVDFRMSDWHWRADYPSLVQFEQRLLNSHPAFKQTLPQ